MDPIKLIICEKFSAAQDMAAALGCPKKESNHFTNRSDLLITWLDGHLLTLADPEYYDVTWADRSVFPILPDKFVYLPKDRYAETHLREVEHLVSLATVVINGCDAGREGEFIFYLFWKYIGKPKKQLFRMWLHTNTTEGIKDAWAKLSDYSNPKFRAMIVAAKLRNQADWLLGMNGSRAVTKLIGAETWSVGRVQTSVLGLVHQRDTKIATYKSAPYFSLYAKFDGYDTYEAKMLVTPDFKKFGKQQHIFAEEQEAIALEYLIRRTGSAVWDAVDTVTEGNLFPYQLFDLSSLQKFCAFSFGWSAARTLAAAQEAYSAEKAISYPRTNSSFLPEDFINVIDGLYKKVWLLVQEEVPSLGPIDMPKASEAGLEKRFPTFDDSKIEDHYAIIPTGIMPIDAKADAMVVWRVVARRFLLHFFPPAKISRFSRTTSLNFILSSPFLTHLTGDAYPLVGMTNVESLVVPGWTDYAVLLGLPLPETLPRVVRFPKPEPDGVKFDKLELYQGFTDPPDHYFEDTLLSAMESENLGTPATQAGILETLVYRDYIHRLDGRPPKIRVAPNGDLLVKVLQDKNLGFLTLPDLTSSWEAGLEKIEMMATDAPDPMTFMREIVECVKEICSIASGTSYEIHCPISKKIVLEVDDKYVFPGLPFPLPKVLARRNMTAVEYRDIILSKKPYGPLEGFVSKLGKPFSAKLLFDPSTKKIAFHFRK